MSLSTKFYRLASIADAIEREAARQAARVIAKGGTLDGICAVANTKSGRVGLVTIETVENEFGEDEKGRAIVARLRELGSPMVLPVVLELEGSAMTTSVKIVPRVTAPGSVCAGPPTGQTGMRGSRANTEREDDLHNLHAEKRAGTREEGEA